MQSPHHEPAASAASAAQGGMGGWAPHTPATALTGTASGAHGDWSSLTAVSEGELSVLGMLDLLGGADARNISEGLQLPCSIVRGMLHRLKNADLVRWCSSGRVGCWRVTGTAFTMNAREALSRTASARMHCPANDFRRFPKSSSHFTAMR